MIESGLKEVSEDEIVKAVEFAKKYHEDILNFKKKSKRK